MNEKEMLKEARDEIKNGLGLDIDDPDVSFWLDGLDNFKDNGKFDDQTLKMMKEIEKTLKFFGVKGIQFVDENKENL